MSKSGGLVYAIGTEGTSWVKIGYTQQPIQSRLKELQTANPAPLTVLASVRVDDDIRRIEAHVHRCLAAERQHGEWFACTLDEAKLVALVTQAVLAIAEEKAARVAQKQQREQEREQRLRQAYEERMQGRAHRLVFDSQAFGQRLRTARLQADVTQTALAKDCEINLPHLNALERGKTAGARAETVLRLAWRLGVSTDYLLGRGVRAVTHA